MLVRASFYSLLKCLQHGLDMMSTYPPIRYPVGTVTEGSAVTLYHETSSAEEILSRLRDLTRDEPDKSDQLCELASRGVLAPFARLETQRRSYRKGEVSIVVDATDWGYRCVCGWISDAFQCQILIALTSSVLAQDRRDRNHGCEKGGRA